MINPFRLPGPKDLGMSESNDYMAGRDFFPAKGALTWEDYHERLARDYPVRNFLLRTIPDAIKHLWWKVSRPFKDAHYWLVSHFVPSRRYHLIDIRQPRTRTEERYRYGWIDRDHAMVFAMFALLVSYIESEQSHNWIPTEEEIAEKPEGDERSILQDQRDRQMELQRLYEYWTVQRLNDLREDKRLIHCWHEIRLNQDSATQAAWDAMMEHEKVTDARLEEMLGRLLKARHAMWS